MLWLTRFCRLQVAEIEATASAEMQCATANVHHGKSRVREAYIILIPVIKSWNFLHLLTLLLMLLLNIAEDTLNNNTSSSLLYMSPATLLHTNITSCLESLLWYLGLEKKKIRR